MNGSIPKVRGLTPHEWLNRCSAVWPREAGLALDGAPSDDGRNATLLLEWLQTRFEAYDLYLGACPVGMDPTVVARNRVLLGSLKKFRRSSASSDTLTLAAIQRYEDNNASAAAGNIPRRFKEGMRRFLRCALAHYGSFCEPHFGPGAVDERISILERWERIPQNGLYNYQDPDDIACWPEGSETFSCRLHAVPKDWNKYRLITIEPTVLSYIQHMTREKIVRAIQSLSKWEARGMRDLTAYANPKRIDPQLRHRELAREGSIDGHLATLDMRDASDLVSLNQVLEVMPGDVAIDLIRSRSESYYWEFNGGRAKPSPVHMYGGMGNATTFPVETLMFHAACYAISDYYHLGGKSSFVSCFGDDMIVSSDLAKLIVDLKIFDEFGWRLNTSKSFYTIDGRFRESCGGQFYCGHDVTLCRYQGGYEGIGGLIAYRDLIHRCAANDRWRALISEPWEEQSMLNSTRWYAEGVLFTSIPWWPDTLRAPERQNPHLWRRELFCYQPRVKETVHSCTGLGPVYGALSGQLRKQTGSRRAGHHKRWGLIVPLPKRMSVTAGWTPVGCLDPSGPHRSKVPGIRTDASHDDLICGYLRRLGQMGR